MQNPSSGDADGARASDPTARAFDAAVAELHGARTRRAGHPPRHSPHRSVAALVAALIVAGALALAWQLSPVSGPVGAGAPMLEEAIVLRCLAPGDAAEVVRPHLRLRANTVAVAPAHAPHVLTVRGTPAQLEHVKAVLDQYEVPGSPACAPSATAT